MLQIAIRALIAFAFLQVLLRLSGKHTVAEVTPFDFVLALVVGDTVDDFVWAEVPGSQFVVAVGTLVTLDLFVAAGVLSSARFARLVEGEPVVFLRNGSLQPEALRHERVSEQDAAALLRRHGLDRERWQELEAARLEDSGESSVARRNWAKEAKRGDIPRGSRQ